MISKRSPEITPYLFLAPALLVLGITVFWPALQAIYFSLVEYDLISQKSQWIGIKNFQRLGGDRLFWQTLHNTLTYLTLVVPLLVILPLGLAILVNQNLKGINLFRAAFYTPVIISMVVAGIAWRWLYAENGLLNQALAYFHLPPLPWLTSPHWAIYSVMTVTLWKGLGYYMVIYLAGLQSIPPDLYEAAAIDGSEGISRHWDITLPLMKPYLFLVAVISAIAATKVFEEVYVMTQGGPRNSSKTLVYYVYEQAFQKLEISYACTIGLVLFLVIMTLSIWNLKLRAVGKE